ncbi:pentapeptide repeat family protein [Desulfosarcina variabilis str. Montpellier]|uniref:pentapeptide repeat-containing protein n=1 Tax=Desulfosarcina variabilis TaxID=2300 RepID=UPI003AFB1236
MRKNMSKYTIRRVTSRIKTGLFRQKERRSRSETGSNKVLVGALIGLTGTIIVALIGLIGTIISARNQLVGSMEQIQAQSERVEKIEENKFRLERNRFIQELFMKIIDSADNPDRNNAPTIKAKIEALGASGEKDEVLDYLIMLRGFYKTRNNNLYRHHIDKTIQKILLPDRKDLTDMKFSLKDNNNALKGRRKCSRVNVLTNFTNFDLSGADFDGCTLVGAVFRNTILENASFEGAMLIGANFQSSDLSGASFAHHPSRAKWKTDINGADFRGATLDGVAFKEVVNLENAHFSPDMIIKFSIERTKNQGPFAGVGDQTIEALYNNHKNSIIAEAKKNKDFLQELKKTPVWKKLRLSFVL